jgi:dynamin-binding protein
MGPKSERLGDAIASPTSPRSLRVHPSSPSVQHDTGITAHDLSLYIHSSISPPLPARSPLRPPPIPASSSNNTMPTVDSATIVVPTSHSPFQYQNPSLSSIDELLDALTNSQDDRLDKIEQSRPESPESLSPVEDETGSSTSSLTNNIAPVSKRNHALLELLSSERAYASDLALIRDIHIPLALGKFTSPVRHIQVTDLHHLREGQPVPFYHAPVTPSGSSSRTVSTSSDSSTSSTTGPPMTREDTRIIFSNVPELALFADMFSDHLEEALGSVLEGGHGEDHVGKLFLDLVRYHICSVRNPRSQSTILCRFRL